MDKFRISAAQDMLCLMNNKELLLSIVCKAVMAKRAADPPCPSSLPVIISFQNGGSDADNALPDAKGKTVARLIIMGRRKVTLKRMGEPVGKAAAKLIGRDSKGKARIF